MELERERDNLQFSNDGVRYIFLLLLEEVVTDRVESV